MTNNNEFVAAIDLGSSKVVTIAAKKDGAGNLDILAVGIAETEGIKGGDIKSIEETADAIRYTINQVQKKAGIKLSEVFVGISGKHINGSINRGFLNLVSPEHVIEKKDVEKLTAAMHKMPLDAHQEIIGIFPQCFEVEEINGIKNPIGMVSRRLEGTFYVVKGDSCQIDYVFKCMNLIGLKIKKIIFEPLTSAGAVLTDLEKETGVILIDLGGRATSLSIYSNGILRRVATIPCGANIITNDIKEYLSIDWEVAERIKTIYGIPIVEKETEKKMVSDPEGRNLKEFSLFKLGLITQSRIVEIIDWIINEIEESGFKEKLSAGMVISGGGAMLKNLPEIIKSRTGINVRVGYPSVTLCSKVEHSICHPMFSSSIGLIIKGYEYNES